MIFQGVYLNTNKGVSLSVCSGAKHSSFEFMELPFEVTRWSFPNSPAGQSIIAGKDLLYPLGDS